MPHLSVNGRSGEFEEKRLVLAIESLGVHIGHRCGGKARCTTCRVRFVSGEPSEMTRAEFDKLQEKGLLGQYRLSCQLTLSQDMQLTAPITRESEGWPDSGPTPADEVEPEAAWHPREELE